MSKITDLERQVGTAENAAAQGRRWMIKPAPLLIFYKIVIYIHAEIVYNIGMNVKGAAQVDALIVINRLLNDSSGIIRTADAVHAGISRTTLGTLVKNGNLERIAHGQYIRPDNMADELYILQQRSEKIIFSHETALFLHDMAERTPLQHSLTIPSSGKLSPVLSGGCKIYYVKPELYGLGRCTVKSKMGHEVLAYDAERTICDILRSRSRVDNQIFAEAMKAYAARKGQNWNNLRNYADAFRVTKLLRQYLEVFM